MSACAYTIVCPFYHRRIAIHDVMYRTYVARYCEANTEACAVYQVLQGSNFLMVPGDLYPNQTFRVAEILKAWQASGGLTRTPASPTGSVA